MQHLTPEQFRQKLEATMRATGGNILGARLFMTVADAARIERDKREAAAKKLATDHSGQFDGKPAAPVVEMVQGPDGVWRVPDRIEGMA